MQIAKRTVTIRLSSRPGKAALQKRIKSFCGAKPLQKLGWTNAVAWGVWMAAMEISLRTLGTQVDDRGSVDAS
jgi:hypothetical protein